jgi:hypothetical protein
MDILINIVVIVAGVALCAVFAWCVWWLKDRR